MTELFQEDALEVVAGDRPEGTQALTWLLDQPHWHQDEQIVSVLQPVLMHLVADYLLCQRRESSGTALDSVAHFHLSNGAMVERINWLADTSARGMR